MNWFNSFNNNFSRTNYGFGNHGGGGNYGGWGFNNRNTSWGNRSGESGRYYNANQYQPYGFGNHGGGGNYGGLGSPYGASFVSGKAGGCGWGGSFRSYDDFLIRGFNPDHEQCNIVATRNRRRDGEQAIDKIGRGGFFGDFAYPRSLYGIS